MDSCETRGEEAIARVTHAAPHLPITEVKHRMRTDPHADRRQRWLIIYNALVEPRRAEELCIPTNIRLIPQPAYSPEVNPVEHIWDELREKYFQNRIFSSLDRVIEALCQGLTALADDPGRLRSLTCFPHLNVLR